MMIDINKSIPLNFENQVIETPNSVAIKTISSSITYLELNEKANRVARTLMKSKNVPATGQISLLFGHEIDMVVGILAVLKSGKTYIPLDTTYPLERLKFMFENSESAVVLTNLKNKDIGLMISNKPESLILIEDAKQEESNNLDLSISEDTLAYILYTSGSTGNPKGVCQTHRNVLHHMRVWIENLKITSNDKLSLQSAYSWDSAAQDIFGAILTGACLYPVKINEISLQDLLDWYTSEQITIWHSTLPLYRGVSKELMDVKNKWDSVRIIALGGDPTHLKDVMLFNQNFSEKAILVNAYGSTESSSGLMNFIENDTAYTENVVPLGRPVRDTDVYIEGKSGERLSDVDNEGEIIVESKFISPAYWKTDSKVYEAKFSKSAKGSEVIKYKTGDRGIILKNGAIALMGRNDFQVKISGIRVNISEIEAILKQYTLVDDAVVKSFEDSYGVHFLAAYLVLDQKEEFSVSGIRKYLAEKVPDFMIPSKFVLLNKLPLTSNSKIDRKSLPYPDKSRPILDNKYFAVSTKLEKQIRTIWEEVLAVNDIGLDDVFFDLGGNSLRLIMVNTQLNKIVPKPIAMVDMFRLSTIRKLARFVSSNDQESDIVANVEKGETRAKKRLKLKNRKNG